MSGGDIGIKGTTLKSQKKGTVGFTKVQFAHEAVGGESSFDLKALIAPSVFVNPSPNVFSNASLNLGAGNLLLTNGAGKVLADGIDFNINGTFISFIGFTALAGEIFYGTVDNIKQEPRLNLADGFQISPSGFLEIEQTTFNIGRAVKIPSANGPEPIIVMRNRTQSVSSVDWNYVDNGSGYAQLIEFTRAGELLESGDKEFVQVFLNGTVVEQTPSNQRRELEILRGQVGRVTEVLDINLGIDPLAILLGSPSQDDLKAFGDIVLGFQNTIATLLSKVERSTLKILPANVTVDGNMFTFNNLVIGNRYSVLITYVMSTNPANQTNVVEILQGAAHEIFLTKSHATLLAESDVFTHKFTATATSLVINAVLLGGTETVHGDGTLDATFAVLTEKVNEANGSFFN